MKASDSEEIRRENFRLFDDALLALAVAAQIAGLPADPEGLRRAFPASDAGALPLTLLRAARSLGLKAKRIETSPEKLDQMPQPTLLLLYDGQVLVLLTADFKKNKKRIMLLRPGEKQPLVGGQRLTRAAS